MMQLLYTLTPSSMLVVLGAVCYFIIRGSMLVYKKIQNRKITWYKELIVCLFSIYSIMVISVTLFPIVLGMSHVYEESVGNRINYIPFVDMFSLITNNAYDDLFFSIKLIIRNIGGNMLMTAPLGILLPLIWKNCRSWRRILLIGFCVSFSIELLQFVENVSHLSERSVDIDDIICNVLGTLIGYMVFYFVHLMATKRKHVSNTVTSNR